MWGKKVSIPSVRERAWQGRSQFGTTRSKRIPVSIPSVRERAWQDGQPGEKFVLDFIEFRFPPFGKELGKDAMANYVNNLLGFPFLPNGKVLSKKNDEQWRNR